MDVKIASPQSKDDEQEDSTDHHSEERCNYDKLLPSYKGDNHGEFPSKRKTIMRKTVIFKPVVPLPCDDKVRYIICSNICFSIYDS